MSKKKKYYWDSCIFYEWLGIVIKILLITVLLFPTIAIAQSAVVPIVVRVHNAGVFQHADIAEYVRENSVTVIREGNTMTYAY